MKTEKTFTTILIDLKYTNLSFSVTLNLRKPMTQTRPSSRNFKQILAYVRKLDKDHPQWES